MSILQKYYYVSCISSYTYDFQDDAEYRSVVIVGEKEAIKVAEYVYHLLFDTAQALWQEYRKKHKAGRGDKVSFDMGFIKGIENNHKKMIGEHRPSSSAYKKGFKNGKNTQIKKGVANHEGGISGFLS